MKVFRSLHDFDDSLRELFAVVSFTAANLAADGIFQDYKVVIGESRQYVWKYICERSCVAHFLVLSGKACFHFLRTARRSSYFIDQRHTK
jgi:hypothetical protein